jgi:hypothetical protein
LQLPPQTQTWAFVKFRKSLNEQVIHDNLHGSTELERHGQHAPETKQQPCMMSTLPNQTATLHDEHASNIKQQHSMINTSVPYQIKPLSSCLNWYLSNQVKPTLNQFKPAWFDLTSF